MVVAATNAASTNTTGMVSQTSSTDRHMLADCHPSRALLGIFMLAEASILSHSVQGSRVGFRLRALVSRRHRRLRDLFTLAHRAG